ncbi:cell division protein ZapE [Arthrobacter sp. MYb227]|uniref:cell division protein ZapE n=1 Tax=Arthrobacter sp. MYb227 TaxID=1848601 RepID=UPI0015E454BE|nr:cell division protein ZapE [Arthrobacter sp. MYb227]
MPAKLLDLHAGAHSGDSSLTQLDPEAFALERAAAQGLVLDAQQQLTLKLLSENSVAHLESGRRYPSGKHVYLWGPPGRGKTWLLGAFFDGLPTGQKRRFHFHEFFRELHRTAHQATAQALLQVQEPGTKGANRGRTDRAEARSSAIERAIESMLGDVEILCFDEFHCNDPGDAMLLSRMFKFIMDRRILLITTSNYPPEELLADEYYHHLILPTIESIRQHMNVHELDAQQDYRSAQIADAQRFGYNTGNILIQPTLLELLDAGLERPANDESVELKPTSHVIAAHRATPDQLWFSFKNLCESLTSTLDYLELSKAHRHWVISEVPGNETMTPFGLRRLANAIDVLYDQDIRLDLILEADFGEALNHLPELDAARLISRLNALQSANSQATPEETLV